MDLSPDQVVSSDLTSEKLTDSLDSMPIEGDVDGDGDIDRDDLNIIVKE